MSFLCVTTGHFTSIYKFDKEVLTNFNLKIKYLFIYHLWDSQDLQNYKNLYWFTLCEIHVFGMRYTLTMHSELTFSTEQHWQRKNI